MNNEVYMNFNGDTYLLVVYSGAISPKLNTIKNGRLNIPSSKQKKRIPILIDSRNNKIYLEKKYYNPYYRRIIEDESVNKKIYYIDNSVNDKKKKTLEKITNSYGNRVDDNKNLIVCPICGNKNGLFADKEMCFDCYKQKMNSKFDS